MSSLSPSASAAAPNADAASSESSSRSITGSAAAPNADAASSESSSESSSGSITGRKRKAPRRRGGDEAVAQLVDLTEISKRRKVTTARRYNKKYAENNIRYAKAVVQWLVLVGRTSNLKSGLTIQPHQEGWWFDWRKINEIADDVCDYCSSKRRKLKCGKIVNEAKHNLSRYKTAVSHCFSMYRVEHANEVFDHAKVQTYKMTCKHFFDSIKKQENDLKAKGLMKIGTGGDGASGLSATATPVKGAGLFGRIASSHSAISKGATMEEDFEEYVQVEEAI